MKQWFVMLVAAAMVCITTSTLWAETEFRIVYNDRPNPPRIMGENAEIDSVKPGTSIELLKMAAERAGLKATFKRVPWKRCLFMVEKGMADATFHASYKPARAEFGVYPTKDDKLDPSRAIYVNAYSLYVIKGSSVTWDGKALQGLKRSIGTQLSYAIVGDLKKMGHQVEEEATVAISLDKLLMGRISVYADIETMADYEIAKYPAKYAAVEKLTPPLKSKDYYLLISKKFSASHPDLTERMFDAIRDVQQTEAYNNMLLKYLE